MAVDPQLMETWARGWASTRGAEPPLRDGDALRIEVGRPDQLRRFIWADVCEDIQRKAEAVSEALVFLKVCAPPQAVRLRVPETWQVRRTGTMMILETMMPSGPPEDSAYVSELWSEGPVRFCVLRTAEGQEVARGRAVRIEDRVIYDRIAVAPEHRRRGLGSRVMRSLQSATDRWSDGVLVATDEGAKLYGALGWRAVSPYTTAVRL